MNKKYKVISGSHPEPIIIEAYNCDHRMDQQAIFIDVEGRLIDSIPDVTCIREVKEKKDQCPNT